MGTLDLVCTLQGTDSRYEFSTGNTMPLVGVPRGLTYWTPQTSDGNFAFDARGQKLAGFRATHMPSPWMGDFGHFDLMPVVGEIKPTPGGRASAYRIDESTFAPHEFVTDLMRYQVRVRLTASRACAVMELTFPPDAGEHAAIVVQTGAAAYSQGEVRIIREGGRTRIIGQANSHNGGVTGEFACHFIVEVTGADVVGHGTIGKSRDGSQGADTLNDRADHASGPRAGAYLRLRPLGKVVARIATSFISADQARQNLNTEIGDRGFDAVAAATGRLWQTWFDRIDVAGGTDADRQTLYSAMYRVGLFPMAMHEFNTAGKPRHYCPYTGREQSGVLYTNNGFWDTYRTVYPLLAMIDREGFGEIVDGFMQAYRRGGWLPRWASPGYRDCMIGSHTDVVIAEAVAHGIGGFDIAEAYEAIRRNAFEPSDRPGVYGRRALDDYHRLGYVPSDVTQYSVCWTLDNAHCDWCVAQVAQSVGRTEDYRTLMARSQNYRNLWHAGNRFMRPRKSDGSWTEPWREFEWGNAYVEGGPWQHSMHVPHDLAGLANLHGGVDALVERVSQMLTTPPRFEMGHYPEEIHEMTEMAQARDTDGVSFGQYAQSNQPVHAFLWIPAALGAPALTKHHVRRVMRSLYTPMHLPGDEDNGEMSAWYVLSAMGQFPTCAGSGKTVQADIGIFDYVRPARAK